MLLEELGKEEEAIFHELKTYFRPNGKPKREQGPTDNIRRAVQARIKNALEAIKKMHSSLYDHLKRSIRTGTTCIYSPPDDIPWVV